MPNAVLRTKSEVNMVKLIEVSLHVVAKRGI